MKLTTVIGIGLVVVTVFGFVLMIATNLPTDEEVKAKARPIRNLSEGITSADSQLNKQLSELRVPTNIPVRVSPDSLGRASIFDGF